MDLATSLLAFSASLTMAVSAIAAALAERAIAIATIGAMSEKEQLFGKGLILTVIPETIVIFGLVIAIMIIAMA